ncbi:MAG TPA: metallopeptidase TldD-related protein, partial [Terriglobia bacterium]|nr:metallopeptidase TldD-related protein [Terriglobia bacterium]
GYEVTDDRTISVRASFGEIVSSQSDHQRKLDIDLRVGSPHLDNTREIRGGMPDLGALMNRFSIVPMPIEDDPAAIRNVIWYSTDQKYKSAVEQLTKVKTNVEVQVASEDKSDDFSLEPAEKYSEPIATLQADPHAWEEKLRKYTAPFAAQSNIFSANAEFMADVETRWYVNSDGSEIQVSRPFYRLLITAFTKAGDGMELPRYESYFGVKPDDLPDDATVLKDVDRMIKDLAALRAAPIVDPFTGPAILSGRASAVFFHEVFGHRVEGHRQKEAEEGQTFKKKVGEQVLPQTFSVYSDPTVNQVAGKDLVGSYAFDNEGVRARRVTVVDHGIFRNFLMSRSPIEGFPNSNGHGRRQQGFEPVARQSNLIVDVQKPVTHDELKKMLIEEMKKQGKPFGLYFEEIEGGFTLTGRTIPNAFNVLPIMVYRIFPDGREELVRGVDLIGTPLTTFSKVITGDNQVAVFNGLCGAESGQVPVSASSPAILVSQIEVQKKEKSQETGPILPAPF